MPLGSRPATKSRKNKLSELQQPSLVGSDLYKHPTPTAQSRALCQQQQSIHVLNSYLAPHPRISRRQDKASYVQRKPRGHRQQHYPGVGNLLDPKDLKSLMKERSPPNNNNKKKSPGRAAGARGQRAGTVALVRQANERSNEKNEKVTAGASSNEGQVLQSNKPGGNQSAGCSLVKSS